MQKHLKSKSEEIERSSKTLISYISWRRRERGNGYCNKIERALDETRRGGEEIDWVLKSGEEVSMEKMKKKVVKEDGG